MKEHQIKNIIYNIPYYKLNNQVWSEIDIRLNNNLYCNLNHKDLSKINFQLIEQINAELNKL